MNIVNLCAACTACTACAAGRTCHLQAVTTLTSEGVRFAPGGIRKGAAGHDVAFIHPKSNAEFPVGGSGVLIELVQAPADVIAAFDAQAD